MKQLLSIRVTTRTSKPAIEQITETSYTVRLTAPPTGGQANKQLIQILSKELGIPKSHMNIIRGEKSRNKVIEITP
ncbi:MAG: DUF167 domain-containing protein [Candidatus Magasanikbacteria bacterium]|jgi:uncharacterized protein (TIGR00251 family)|nr:DUF167 domain-containing protein [Candidatus Magasanikbacteria bacterium]